MEVQIRKYEEADLPADDALHHHPVLPFMAAGQFARQKPQRKGLFAQQTLCAVAEREGKVCGLYILHPNNVGRCGHIANASYAVAAAARGRHVGEALVRHSLTAGREQGFRILQFNAVVNSNRGAIRLYEKLGFMPLGVIPGGFHRKDGGYEDISLFYHTL